MVERIPKIIVPAEEKKPSFRFSWRIFYLILIIMAILFLIYGLFFSSFFKVKNIDLKGANLVDGDQLKKVITYALNEEDNIFLYRSADISAKIKENFPLVSEVNIQKGLPDTIRVIIIERQPVIVWQTADKKYLVDKEGYAYLEADANNAKDLPVIIDSANLPVVLSKKVASKNFLDFIKEIIEKFTPRSNLKIKELRIRDTTFDLDVLTTDGFIVLFDTTRSAETELDDLRRVMNHLNGAKPKEYIDLRVEGWAYYK
ncbi:MAG: cell division protein FtsQ [Candidatus Berkelbacteria bacterium Licking1014_96]|uniref:Cell division protein FtsQ n=1 Tax=Candidatus Berkelbacteria bacterium Licking1014_96 TaxID=2017149 RepID=A0A554LH47_9BACT|nr:MAG: cell division protein FtsQ [Candidatus Berkelbacteria bacterium Licking1014_96]